ncbi:phosphoribosyltransferase [Truepera radiovictrix]|uniref:Phosphoribosyltransferase n=1 Tax=Truepera radiovictrix (strain DSM 17093 / CIP 108686 / LMG 22925 / RQ-24) TaxID=649638 RepID=D7CSX5_TRURR|nr:phosphoribosyltransferase family protein [Truepera radiovictrix]ADI13742.1 phosphoribosyltransferase [Truepera radiovictrix DSM 17093]WMT57694.1 phosphoribosyltransferase family protein [Truepera radiovictrix]
MTLFRDRRDAGRRLAAELGRLGAAALGPDVFVLALPRGGVPVAFEVARALGAPLDVFVVRKLGVPGHEELAMGAIASGGSRVLNEEIISSLDLSERTVAEAAAREARELARREALYRGARPFPDLTGRAVIVVDDGLATGATMRAAVTALRREADAVVCVFSPEPFWGVGRWYEHFPQTSDAEVQALLERARKSA